MNITMSLTTGARQTNRVDFASSIRKMMNCEAEKDVLELLLTIQSNKNDATMICATMICLQWIYCNVYPLSIQQVQRKIEQIHKNYRAIGKFTKNERMPTGNE